VAPMPNRLTLARALHWTTAVLVLGLLAASDPATRATLGGLFALVGGAFVAHAALRGPVARPGPRSRARPAARLLHLAIHRGLLAAVALTILTGLPAGMAGPEIAEGLGGGSPVWHGRAFDAMLALAAAHVVLNLWRSSLGEPAFRTMTGGSSPG